MVATRRWIHPANPTRALRIDRSLGLQARGLRRAWNCTLIINFAQALAVLQEYARQIGKTVTEVLRSTKGWNWGEFDFKGPPYFARILKQSFQARI